MATGVGKRQKALLTIESSDDEEVEEQERQQVEKVIPPKQATSKPWQPWKLKIEKINTMIANEGNFVQMNKFYDLHKAA